MLYVSTLLCPGEYSHVAESVALAVLVFFLMISKLISNEKNYLLHGQYSDGKQAAGAWQSCSRGTEAGPFTVLDPS